MKEQEKRAEELKKAIRYAIYDGVVYDSREADAAMNRVFDLLTQEVDRETKEKDREVERLLKSSTNAEYEKALEASNDIYFSKIKSLKEKVKELERIGSLDSTGQWLEVEQQSRRIQQLKEENQRYKEVVEKIKSDIHTARPEYANERLSRIKNRLTNLNK